MEKLSICALQDGWPKPDSLVQNNPILACKNRIRRLNIPIPRQTARLSDLRYAILGNNEEDMGDEIMPIIVEVNIQGNEDLVEDTPMQDLKKILNIQ